MSEADSVGEDSQPSRRERRNAAARVGPKVELKAVRLVKLDYESFASSIEPNTEVSVDIQVGEVQVEAADEAVARKSGTQSPDDGNACMLVYRLAAEVACSVEAVTILRSNVAFDLVYEVLTGIRPTEEEINAFGSVSAAFTGFPYLRELLQSLTVRSELPPLTLGVMRSPLDGDSEQLE